jgi:hypothetical protein
VWVKSYDKLNSTCRECDHKYGKKRHKYKTVKDKSIGGHLHRYCTGCKTWKDKKRHFKKCRKRRCNECHNAWQRNYKKTSPKRLEMKIANNLRSRIRYALVGKPKVDHTLILVGCNISTLKGHLEKLFQPGMSWENYGKWHIDHIIPCAAFNLSKEEEQRKCFHFTNLQPLWEIDNKRKKDKIPA